MKRFFFSLIALSAAAIGCTQSALLETPDLDGTAVSFSPYTGRTPESKATSIDTPTLLNADNGFNVYAFLNKLEYVAINGVMTPQITTEPYLQDANVTLNSQGNWTYSPMIYWPESGSSSTLSFVAYSANAAGHFIDADGNNTDSGNNPIKANSTGFTFMVPTDIDDQVDLLATAYQDNLKIGDSSNGKITLQFHHLLSRVGFKVQTTTNTTEIVTISTLKLKGSMYQAGKLVFNAVKDDGVPALNESHKEYVEYDYEPGDAQITNAFSDAQPVIEGKYLMIMPHIIYPGDDHIIEVTYQIGNSKEKTAEVELPSDFEFVAGKAYEFILHVSTSKISFSVVEQGWNESGNSTTHPIEPQPQNAVDIYSPQNITTTTADVSITVNRDNLYDVGVAFKIVNGESWSYVSALDEGDKPEKGETYTVSLDLESNITYEYCAYTKATSESAPVLHPDSNYPTFTTKVALSLLTNLTEKTAFTITPTATCDDISADDIEEYGFCWIEGEKTPSIIVDGLINNIPIIIDENTPEGEDPETIVNVTLDSNTKRFSGVITGLKPYTQYTVCAYVKKSNGDVSYSAGQLVRTMYSVSDDDYSGASVDNSSSVNLN